MLSKDEYSKNLGGYNIVGCTVRSKDAFIFVAQEDYTKWPNWNGTPPDDDDLHQRVVPFLRTRPGGQQWSMTQLNAFEGLSVAMTFDPKPQAVVSGVRGFIYSIGSGEAALEKDAPTRGGVTKLKTIGQHVYLAGGRRTVLRRTAKDEWVQLTKQMPVAKGFTANGFEDLDGFSEADIYAAGGDGDVWHFDGKTWRQCAFPSNQMIKTVCCGGDGNVYISGIMGATFAGKQNTWKLVAEPNLSIPFKDMVWYEDCVWCTNDYNVWQIKDGKLELADMPGSTRLCCGYLSVRDGVLLLAGHGGAAFREKGEWNLIFHPSDFNR